MHRSFPAPDAGIPRIYYPLFLIVAVLIALATLHAQHAPDWPSEPPAAPATQEAHSSFDLGTLPLSFVPHHGQNDPYLRFQAQGLGGTLAFTRDGVTLALPVDAEPATVADGLRVRFEQASATAQLRGDNRQPGTVNYLLGNDPAEWRTNLPTYAALIYSGLYQGIDLRYDGQRSALKGTFTVAPGANPLGIRWRYEGSQGVRIDPQSGDLRISLPGGADPLIEHAPVAWQEVAGKRQAVLTN